MKKHIISLLVLFLLLSTSFVGVSNQEKQETVDIDKSELPIDGDPNYNILHTNETPGIQWSKSYGTDDWVDNVEKVRQTTDGGYILVGNSQSYCSDHNFDAWLVKTDAAGNEEWNRSYGVHGSWHYDLGRSVEQTSDGGYILSGTRNSCFWLVKTDAQGEVQWENNTYCSGRADCVIQVNDGGYIVTGEKGHGVPFIKTDAQGTMLWTKIFFPVNDSFGWCVQQTSDGGFILAGDTNYYSNISSSTKSLLLKTDQDGNEQWNKTYWRCAHVSSFSSVQQTPDQGYIVSGTINGTPWLVRTDENGIELWNKTCSYTEFSSGAPEVDQTIDGGFILVAEDGNSHSCVFKIDADGTIIWELPIESSTGSIPVVLHSILQTTDGGYITAGSCSTGSNGFLIKIGHVPQVEIIKPTNGVYLFDKKILDFPRPLIIGRITIEATASDTMYTIERVEFSVDGTLQSTDTTAPYNWQWTTWSFFKHTITATAYNSAGNCSSETINVLKIF